MQKLDYQLADVFALEESAEDGIRRVYGELAERSGDLVGRSIARFARTSSIRRDLAC